MDESPPDLAEETFPQSLRRRYAYLAAWLLRLNRLPEPSRLEEPTRSKFVPRTSRPAKTAAPATPEVDVMTVTAADNAACELVHATRGPMTGSGVFRLMR